VPVFRLPRPGGTFGVGVTDIVTDAGALRIWYPADPTARGRAAPYRAGERPASLPARLQRSLVRGAAQLDVGATRGPFPLLLYIPGWGGTRGENTALAEFLAARGYVIAALDDREAAPALDFSTPAQVVRTQQRADAKVDRLAAGASRELADLVHGTTLGAIPIDPTRIGLVGYSFGGAVAAETACRDARVRAAVNLDGWMFGSAARAGVPRPYLVIGTGLPQLDATRTPWAASAGLSFEQRFDRENERRIIAGLEHHGGYFACIDGTRHAAFSDAAILPLRFGRPGGPLSGRSTRRIVRTLVGQFCDRFIAGLPAPLFDRRSEPAAGRDVEFDPYLRWIVRRAPPAGGG